MALSPLDINTAARQRMNAIGDDFWSDQEIYTLIYQACLELTNDSLVIERTFMTTSIAGQQEYDFPTNAVSIKRVTYDGRKLKPYTFREDDTITVLNDQTTSTGTPDSYCVWNNVFFLRPIPATDGLDIKVFAYVQPQLVTSTSTLEIPVQYQSSIINYVLSYMCSKNKDYQGAGYYMDLWNRDKLLAKKLNRRKDIGDAFQVVKNVDILPQTMMGNI